MWLTARMLLVQTAPQEVSIPLAVLIAAVTTGLGWWAASRKIAQARIEDRNQFKRDVTDIVKDFHKTNEWEDDVQDVVRACTMDDGYVSRLETRMRQVHKEEIDAAFGKRSASFVNGNVFEEYRNGIERRLGSLESAIRENTKEMRDSRQHIAAEVAAQVIHSLTQSVIVQQDPKNRRD